MAANKIAVKSSPEIATSVFYSPTYKKFLSDICYILRTLLASCLPGSFTYGCLTAKFKLPALSLSTMKRSGNCRKRVACFKSSAEKRLRSKERVVLPVPCHKEKENEQELTTGPHARKST